MDEANDTLALERITNDVDDSQIKVFLTSHCLNAQEYLAGKLKKLSERLKESCNYLSNSNLKLEAEIKQAEEQIKSMLIAQESMKYSNIEMKKHLLLKINRKEYVTKFVTEGKNKYETLWLDCKNRYESIPFVNKLIQDKERQRSIEKAIEDINEKIIKLYDDIETKRKIYADLDKQRCVEVANFMINERPRGINFVKEKSKQIQDLIKEIEQLQPEKITEVMLTTEVPVTSKTIENVEDNKLLRDEADVLKTEHDPLIPKLNLINFDLDIMDVNLDQVKIKKDKILNSTVNRINSITTEKQEEIKLQKEKEYKYTISPYFGSYKEDKQCDYSDRKLIHVLEDISINNCEAYNIIKKVNTDKLKTVDEISETNAIIKPAQKKSKDKEDKTIVSEEIEEVDLTASALDNIIIPPSQFLDITMSDIMTTKKKVAFDLSASMQIKEIMYEDERDDNLNESANQTFTSQQDANGSAASDDSIMKIQEMIFKKHNIDLSPQFKYAKPNVMLKRDDDKNVISKFFQGSVADPQIMSEMEESIATDKNDERNIIEMEVEQDPGTEERLKSPRNSEGHDQKDANENILGDMEEDDLATSSLKPNEVHLNTSVDHKSEAPVSGILFTHGAKSIPDSLNVSLSTAGFEDSDFPHCIDANLLLSPKADIPNDGNNEGISLEAPNFLSGFRRTFRFGAPSTSSESRPPDSSEQNEGNHFSFNFGGTKKNRGLFSLFN